MPTSRSISDRIERPLPVTPPFAFDLTVSVHGRFAQEAVHRYAPGRYWRAFWLNGRPVAAALQQQSASVALTLSGPDLTTTEIDHLSERMSFLFALQEDPAPFVEHAQGDPILAELIQRYPGLRPARSPGLHEQLVGGIIAQQITLSFAATVRQRLVHRYGHPVPYGDMMLWTFPTPEALADATVEDLMGLQFSRRKAEYVIGVSRSFAVGEIDEGALARLPDEAVIGALIRQRGLGRWSAEWALIRGLGRPDVAPVDDIGVQQAVGLFYQIAGRFAHKASAAQVAQVAEGWRPFRSMATTYLLTALRLREKKSPVL